MHYLNANKTAGEEARRLLHKNVSSNIEQVLGATPQKAPTKILIMAIYIYIYIYIYEKEQLKKQQNLRRKILTIELFVMVKLFVFQLSNKKIHARSIYLSIYVNIYII